MLEAPYLLRFIYMTTLRLRITGLLASISAFFLGTFSLALAQTVQPTGSANAATTPLGTFLLLLVNIINNVLVPLLFGVAFIVFLWGMFRYFILGAANEEKRAEGQKLLIYGLIGFFVMLSLWGIVNVVKGTFIFGSDTQPAYPTFTVQGQSAGGTQGSPSVLPASGQATCSPACTGGKTCSAAGLCI